MFQELRWKLTRLFVVTSTAVFLAMGVLGGCLVYMGLTRSLDQELGQMAAELCPLIDLSGPSPSLGRWRREQRPASLKLLAYIQIFDSSARLVEEHGTNLPVPSLGFKQAGIEEVGVGRQRIRIYCQPIRVQGRLCGWLQISRVTSFRDGILKQYSFTLLLLTVALLLSLTATGYLVAGTAISPVRSSFDVLRRFVADAGHELKTPLTLLQGNVEALELGLAGSTPESLRARLKGIEEACAQMNGLVSDLLLLARLEAPNRAFSRQKVDLASLVGGVADGLMPLYKQKGVSLVCQLAPEHAWCHAPSLEKAVANLLRNALAYTPAGGQVSVGLRVLADAVVIEVTDTGAGIPADQIPRIFDRFHRGGRSADAHDGGSGLGLSIVKAVMEEHRGSLSVRSRVGEGSTFTLRFPSR